MPGRPHILLYSPDIDLCASLLMYFKESYSITVTSQFHFITGILNSLKFDLLFLDHEPTVNMSDEIDYIHKTFPELKVIMTYVFKNGTHTLEEGIKDKVNAIFYKPFDLQEVSKRIDNLLKKAVEN